MAANASITAMQKSSMKSYRDTSYREKPATPNSPSGTTVTTMYDHMLSPSSPAEVEKNNGRLRNDLLDEICIDMGVDDSMQLDFDDFCQEGQQGPAASTNSQRFGGNLTEGRRPSATTSSSYSTSDSLSAIAKLTHSIPGEGNSNSEIEVKSRSPDCSSVKQEPCDVESEPGANINDTDQGKAAAAAGKLALQKQLSGCSSDLKRKREMVAQEMPSDFSNTPMHISALGNLSQGQHSAPPAATAQRCQSYVDYSYQDDFAMEDMTAPDTMINFSALPQQPNYYQCPQNAADTLNLGFNMSLHAPAQQGFASTPIPPAHQHQHTQNAGRFAFGSLPPHTPNDVHMGRSSPQPRLHGSMQSHGVQMRPQQGDSFQAYPGRDVLRAQQSQNVMQRTDAFPAPMQNARSHFQPAGQLSPPHTPKSSGVPVHQSTTSLSSTPQRTVSSTIPSAGVSRTSTANGGNSQQDFLQQLISDSSNAFRSHPLFPLLRDLIIADVNFYTKSFPHSLIVNLPSDFNKLLKNYLSRNPPLTDYQCIPSVESVLMDALKYAHHILIEKINQWKQVQPVPERQQMVSTAQTARTADTASVSDSMNRLSGVSEYCDSAVKHDVTQAQQGYVRTPMNVAKTSAPTRFRPSRRGSGSVYSGDLGPPTPGSTYGQLSVDTGSSTSPTSSRNPTPLVSQPTNSMYTAPQTMHPQYPSQHSLPVGYSRSPNPRNPYMTPHGGPPLPPPNYTVSPNNPPLSRHQQLYEMGPPPSGPGIYSDPNSSYHDPYNNCMPPPEAHHHRLHHLGPAERQLMYLNNINNQSLVNTMMEGGKDLYDSISDNASVISGHSMQGSVKGQQQGQGKPTEGRKHASLPKEAVNVMLNWLREHQDKPYPNDDEKGMLIKQTGLSITQINYWFTNARRRLLPKWRGEDM